MDNKLESILKVMKEMNSFSPINDDLSALIHHYDDEELNEDDLFMVSAAYLPKSFAEFIRKLNE